MEASLLKIAGFLLAGLWTGWAVFILAEDVKIRWKIQARRIRAVILGLVLLIFLAVLLLLDFRHFVLFVSAMTLGVVLMNDRSKKI